MLKCFHQIIRESGNLGFLNRLMRRVLRESSIVFLSIKNAFYPTFQKNNKYEGLGSRLLIHPIKHKQFDIIPKEVMQYYMEHRFDLLGSGWIKVFYGMNCPGLLHYRFSMGLPLQIDGQGKWLHGRINRTNLKKSQKIWQHIDSSYEPIDWQLDFKSGFRWSERTLSQKIKFGHQLGVDIKVPWELARMQHLPQLALASFHLSADEQSLIQQEYKNQVLDFIATNPPGFGVNWVCPMDVAIRAANWLLAWDLLRASSVRFPEYFEEFLTQSIYEHGQYILNHLEWSNQRANHYLANIAGLAFIAAYLPSSKETDTWLAFARQELIVEVDRQFEKDGGNFEGSTAYHRFSAEMVFYASALILGLPRERLQKFYPANLRKKRGTPSLKRLSEGSDFPFPLKYFDRMERMVEFIIDITKPCGEIPQIGDNDSGRFFKLQPIFQSMSVKVARETYANLDNYVEMSDEANYYMEKTLDCRHLISSASGLFERQDFKGFHKKNNGLKNDETIIHLLSGGNSMISRRSRDKTSEGNSFFAQGEEEDFHANFLQILKSPLHQIHKIEFTAPNSLLDDIALKAYKEFGLYIVKSPCLYLAIRCWVGDNAIHSNHRHFDQLSLDLSLNGEVLIYDPGTYLYTPIPLTRHHYRTHHFPFLSTMIHDPLPHVFSPINVEKMRVNYFGKKGFIATFHNGKAIKKLAISLEKNWVGIYYVNTSWTASTPLIKDKPPYSPGYGVQLKSKEFNE